MGAKTVKFHKFKARVSEYYCEVRKTTKEWEIVDKVDGLWVCAFAVKGGNEVKEPYLKNFEKIIKEKRLRQAAEKVDE